MTSCPKNLPKHKDFPCRSWAKNRITPAALHVEHIRNDKWLIRDIEIVNIKKQNHFIRTCN